MLVGLRVRGVVGKTGLMNRFGNEAMTLVVFEIHVMVECFGDMMFGCTFVGCYGRNGM